MLRRSNKTNRVSVIGAVITAGLLVISSTTGAHAASVKQGVACAKKGAKTTAGGTKYTCGVNPASSSKKLVWVSADCISSDTAYKSSVTESAAFANQQISALNQIAESIDASKKLVEVLNQQISDAKTKKYIVGYDHGVKPALPITAIGVDAAIASLQAIVTADSVKRDTAGVQRDLVRATLAKTYNDSQILAFANDLSGSIRNTDKNVQNYANWIRAYAGYDGSISSTNKNIANLQKILTNLNDRLAKAQAQVTSMTSRYDVAKAQQPTLLAQIKTNSVQALQFRTIACKAGL